MVTQVGLSREFHEVSRELFCAGGEGEEVQLRMPYDSAPFIYRFFLPKFSR